MSIVKQNNGSLLPANPGLLFDDFLSRELFNWGNNFSSTLTTMPLVNIRETPENFEVDVAAPGMEKKDFKITLEDNLLTISASPKNNAENTRENYIRKEFGYHSFQRSLKLEKEVVDEEHIQAGYENGILKLTIPKTEQAKKQAPRIIEIH